MKQKQRSVTSYDVARAAGVSQSAVSRAFSPGASIAEEKRRHIIAVAAEMGYQRNAIARSMSTARSAAAQRSGMVGLIVTRLEDPFFSLLIAQFCRLLHGRGWHVLLFTVDAQSQVDDALASLMQYQIDGVVILSALLSSRMAEVCRAQGTPVLLYNRHPAGSAASAVQIDNREGGRIAAELLCDSGFQRIAFLGVEGADQTSAEREAGFCERLAEGGRPLFLRENGDYTFESGREACLRLFSRSERPDALFCASDQMALGVLHAARTELGLDAPRDFSLIGFDDIPAAAWPGHRLTTIRQPVERMIREGVELLIARMEDPEAPPQRSVFSGTLILRDTVRTAAAAR